MTENKSPRLRTVEKVKPPYPLNQFPPGFGVNLGKEIVYGLATKGTPDIAGPEWEQIFAICINADWKPSNVGLDDVILGNCAWTAKSVKASKPHQQRTVRLISGRNSPAYSYDQKNFDVLIKSTDLTELVIFEFDTVLYPTDQFVWSKNKKGNLEGFYKATNTHRFTWQPHGSQFTIIEPVPDDSLLVKIKKPPKLDKAEVLKALSYDES